MNQEPKLEVVPSPEDHAKLAAITVALDKLMREMWGDKRVPFVLITGLSNAGYGTSNMDDEGATILLMEAAAAVNRSSPPTAH